MGPVRESKAPTFVHSSRVISQALDINMVKTEIPMPAAHPVATPFDRRAMKINSDVTALGVEVVLKMEGHQPAAAADVQNALTRLHSHQQSQIRHKLSPGGLKGP